jgi:hypothetical protein
MIKFIKTPILPNCQMAFIGITVNSIIRKLKVKGTPPFATLFCDGDHFFKFWNPGIDFGFFGTRCILLKQFEKHFMIYHGVSVYLLNPMCSGK